jgi:hypothetical protein
MGKNHPDIGGGISDFCRKVAYTGEDDVELMGWNQSIPI